MAYNPAVAGITVNKPIAQAVGAPDTSRKMFFDEVTFKWRAFMNTAEVIAYFDTPEKRFGGFSILVNTGGTLSGGVVTGGSNDEWWWKDNLTDGGLVLKTSGVGGGSTIKQYDI